MYTLPHHVEFLSERWAEEAGSFLSGAVPKIRERVRTAVERNFASEAVI